MIEVLKQALDALEFFSDTSNSAMDKAMSEDAIASLRQAIAKAEDNYQGSDAAKAAHMMDLYTALGVRWGDNPFAVIAKMRSIAELESQEPVATKIETQQFSCFHVGAEDFQKLKALPVGTKLYTYPPQRTESEPVAYINVEMRRLEFAHDYVKWDTPTTVKLDKIPLYTHLPQRTWVGLTDEEVRQMCGSVPSMKEAVREAESKLKERNT